MFDICTSTYIILLIVINDKIQKQCIDMSVSEVNVYIKVMRAFGEMFRSQKYILFNEWNDRDICFANICIF